MRKSKWMTPVLGAALLTFTGVAIAQDSTSANDKAAQTSSSSSSTSGTSQLSAKDQAFVKKAAQGGLEEVELGKMVAQKAQSQDVKDFAQRMVTDHTKANEELKSLAEQKGVKVPTTLSPQGKATKARLEKLSGTQLDEAYMRNMVKDHTKDVNEFQQESNSAKDSDVKSWAGKTLPTLQDHLKEAKQISSKISPGKGGQQTAQQ